MKIKHYLFGVTFMLSCIIAKSQTTQLAAWDFAGGNTTPILSSGISAASINVGGSLQRATSSNGFLVTNLLATGPSQALNGFGTTAAQYISFTISPTANYSINISSVAIYGASQNQNREFLLAYVNPSTGNVVTVTTISINTPYQTVSFPISLTNITTSLEFRFYIFHYPAAMYETTGFGDQSGAPDLVINGNVTNSSTQIIPGTWSLQGNTIAATQFLGSTNNQDLPFYTNNTEKVRIGANGNVGIGTTTLTQKLNVAGDIGITGDLYQNGTKLNLSSVGEWTKGGFVNPNATGPNHYLSQLSNTYESKLLLNADVTEINSWVNAWQGIAVGGYNKYQSTAHTTNDMINGTPSYGIGLNTSGIVQVGGYNGIDFLDNTYSTAPAISVKNGKVGIGIAVSSTQTEKLLVNGNSHIQGNLSVDGLLFSNGKLIDLSTLGSGGSNDSYMTTVVSGITYTYYYSPLYGQVIIGATEDEIINNVSAQVVGNISYGQNQTNVQSSFQTVPTTGPLGYYYLTTNITTLGINETFLVGDKVGIGTSIPGVELDVKGDAIISRTLSVTGLTRLSDVNVYGAIHTNGLHISPNTIDWPDYIFSKSYELRSLKDLQTYIDKHSHLPGIPSASDVKKNGVDIAEINRALLEKVEELTLYTLQIKKELDELKSKVK